MRDLNYLRRRRSFLPLPFKRFTGMRLLSLLSIGVFFLVVAGFVVTALLFAWYSRDLPKPDKVNRTGNLSTIIYDRKGEPLYGIYRDFNRLAIPFEEMPEQLRQAAIAIEDKDFYTHKGFSIKGIFRAFFNIIFRGRVEGGSTLTQQLVKNVLLSSERTIPRKIKEFILSVEIERRYTKDQILQMYLNEAPFGGTTVGVETAAETYFGKKAKDLTLTEGVVLAGMPQRPSYFSPYSANSKAYVGRASEVIRRMREDGYVSREQEDEVLGQLDTLTFKPQGSEMKAPHFVMYVREQLVEMFGERMVEEGGLKVHTTLDLELQEKAEEIVRDEVGKAKGLKVGNGATVGINPENGEVVLMVGSKDYFAEDYDGNYNVTLANRQPGSAIKPITYAAAFKKGYTPSSIIMDVETHFPGGLDEKDYVPKNYDLKHRGPVQLRYALGNSINVSAVKLLAYTGIKDMLTTAYAMGLSTLEPTRDNIDRFGLSITLGGGEVRLIDLTRSFGVFARGGELVDGVAIVKVEDSHGKVLFEHKKKDGKRVLGEDVSFLISNILSDNDARREVFGPRSWLVISGKTVAVKTGTTDDKKDNWTVGYTPSFVLGVWVGNNDNSVMDSKLASGVSGAAPIWNRIMSEYLKDRPNEEFKKPDSVVQIDIDAFGGGLPKDGYPTRKEYFVKGTEPTQQSPIYKRVKVSKDTGKLANEVEVAKGSYEEKEFVVFEEKDPISTDGKNRFAEGINAWANGQPDPKYKPPTENSSASSDRVVVNIFHPEDKAKFDQNDIRIDVRAYSLSPIKKMEIIIDGDVKKTVNSSELDEIFNISDGTHTIEVRATDESGKSETGRAQIGVKTDWDSGSQSSSETPSPTP